MNSSRASEILSILAGAYPNQTLGPGMDDQWVNALATTNFHDAEQAAREWISTEKRWPSPAELNAIITRNTGGDDPYQRSVSNLRCDGSRWIDRGQGPFPCPACNPWQHELWDQGELHKRHPRAPEGFIMPMACTPRLSRDDEPVRDRNRAVRLMVAGYREGKREMGMSDPEIDERITERYSKILAWASVIPQPRDQELADVGGQVVVVEPDDGPDEEIDLGEPPGW